jgi:hypothetical protein
VTYEAKAQMVIRKPVAEVFEAFVDADVTTKFWFTKSSAVGDALDSTAGFNLVLAGAKAYLEHGIEPNLVADHMP